jgi:type I restriction enzyme S subunit
MKAPIGWKHVLLHQVAEVRTGLSKSSSREGHTIRRPYLRVANVQDGYLDLRDVQEIDVPAKQVERFTLKPGDLLLIEGNGNPKNLGRGCLWDGQVNNCVHQNHVFAVRVSHESELRPKFLAIQLESSRGRNYLLSCAKGSTGLSTLNSEQLRRFPLLLPSVQEQEVIIALFTIWNTAIEKTERLIAAKERQLKALTQCLLTGNKRIKGYDKKWRKYRLSEVLTEHCEASSGREEVYSVSVHKGLINQVEHLGRVFATKDTSNYNLVKSGDVVYTKSPTGDFPYGIVKQSLNEFSVIVSPLYGVFTSRSQQLGTFLNFYFESPVRSANYLLPIIQKGAKNTINITNNTFLSNSLYLPSCDEETKAIADTLNTARHEIDLLKKQSEAYRRQKRGLMQKLLTREWLVKVGKEAV